MYAQYQLSQIVASGGPLTDLGPAVASEIARLSGATTVLLWLAESDGPGLRLATDGGDPSIAAAPERFDDLGAGVAWAERLGATAVGLVDDAPAGLFVLVPPTPGALDPEGLRVLRLARHELAIAFRSAGLRGPSSASARS